MSMYINTRKCKGQPSVSVFYILNFEIALWFLISSSANSRFTTRGCLSQSECACIHVNGKPIQSSVRVYKTFHFPVFAITTVSCTYAGGINTCTMIAFKKARNGSLS